MNERTSLTVVDQDYDDISVDVGEFVELAVEDEDAYIDDASRVWWPDNFVEAMFGARGSGKSMRMAYHLLRGLEINKAVFTNLTLHPERCGIAGRAQPLDLEQMVSFDTVLQDAVMGIEELGTWIRRERAMATGTQLFEQFWTQLRKRNLVIEFTNQSMRLPQDLWDQIDLVTFCQDLYFSEYGHDHNLQKGTVFLYTHIDRSGIFTGEPRFWWETGLEQGWQLWDKYESYQVFDPKQAFRRVRITGGDMILNAADGQIYSQDEMSMVNRENRLRLFNRTLTAVWRQWDGRLLDLVKTKKGIIEETNEFVALSTGKIRNMILRLKGNERKLAAEAWQDLNALAKDGRLAKFRNGDEVIVLYKPL